MFLSLDFIIICIIVGLSDASKHKRYRILNDSAEILANPSHHLDLRGNLRKTFYLESALYNPAENSICSPTSALMPLGKLALGAEGKSLDELLKVLGLAKKHKINRHFKRLIAELRYLPGVKLNVASRLYVSEKVRLNNSFRDAASEIFQSSAEKVDFKSQQFTAQKINGWVSQQTSGKIKDMLAPSEISPTDMLIIVNAVYFKGKWLKPFQNESMCTFHSPKGKRKVRMMKIKLELEYTESTYLNAQLLKIPYEGEKAYFLIVLPNRANNLKDLLDQLHKDPTGLDSAMSKMSRHEVSLTMPLFRMTAEINLKTLYKKIGLHNIFNMDSGLDGIVRNQTLGVTGAKQKAFIEVNKEGTEAAAASSTNLAKTMWQKTVHFKANRPFLFFIIVQNQQLFSGTVVNPHH